MSKTWVAIGVSLLLAGCASVQPTAVTMHGGDPSSAGAPSAPLVPPRDLLTHGMSQEIAPPPEGSPHHDHGADLGADMDSAEPQVVGGPEALVYACPMDPDVVTSLPGSCPKCGMTLEPVKASEVYVCPMHAHVMSRLPGDCPECGMTLVKQEAEE